MQHNILEHLDFETILKEGMVYLKIKWFIWCLDSLLSMDILGSGPQSLRSEFTDTEMNTAELGETDYKECDVNWEDEDQRTEEISMNGSYSKNVALWVTSSESIVEDLPRDQKEQVNEENHGDQEELINQRDQWDQVNREEQEHNTDQGDQEEEWDQQDNKEQEDQESIKDQENIKDLEEGWDQENIKDLEEGGDQEIIKDVND